MKAKITPPALHGALIARPALEKRLDEALERRLTVVVAAAGYGKSTALAAWAAGRRAAWLDVERADDDLGRFAPLLLEALRLVLPSLPDFSEALGALRERPGDAPVQPVDALAGLIGDALEAVVEPLVLVVDDVHQLPPQSPAARLIESLCRYAPPLFHLVLSSREEVPFSIEGLRGRGEVLTLDAPALAFSPKEVSALLVETLGRGAASLAPALYELSGGWPAAVVLAIEGLRTVPEDDRTERLRELRRPGSPLIAYLAEEVVTREPAAVRELLRRAALFERFTPDLCVALGLPDAEETLAELVRRGPFLQRRAEWLSLHELVGDYVSRAWPFAPEEERDLRRRAADWFERDGKLDDALTSLAAGGESAEIARLLREHGEAMLASGAAETVLRFAEGLPADLRDGAIERLAGEAHALRGEPEAALACLRRAGGDEGALAPELAWRLVVAHLLRDDLDAALDVYNRTAIDGGARDEALLFAWTAGVQLRRGDSGACRALAERALAAAAPTRDERAVAAAHTAAALAALAEGDSLGCETHLRQAFQGAERVRDILQLVRIHNLWGSLLLEQGMYREAIEKLEEAIRLAELGGFATPLALGYMNRGLCRWCLGRLDEAMADYDAAIAIYRTTGTRETAYALIGRGDVYRERGDLALARVAYEEGLRMAEESGDLQSLVPGLYQLAKVLVNDEPDEATRLAERAVSYGWPDRAWALASLGWVALARRDEERAAAAAEQALAAARERGDRFGLADALALKAVAGAGPAAARRLLEESLAVWREIGNPLQQAAVELALARLATNGGAQALERAESALRSLGVRVSAAGPAGLLRTVVRQSTSAVEVQTLGGFQILREGVSVPLAEWRSKKARDLLKILVARRGRPVPRDVLVEALWPGEDPVEVANRLSVAISTLRSVLDPAKRFDAAHLVISSRDVVALELAHVRVDVEEFLAAARAVRNLPRQETREQLAAVEATYAGDFLEEDLYEDWSVPLREEARATYVEITRALAEAAAEAGDADAAIRYLLRVLERDLYDEQAHVALVAALAAAGRHGEARRAYRAYCGRMEEIAVEPAPFPRRLVSAGPKAGETAPSTLGT